MSHVSIIEHEITDLNTLKAVCKSMGLVFKENQKTYKWFGEYMGDYPLPDGFTKEDLGKCLHAISVPNANYEIGVVSNEQGYYQLLWDFWGSGGLEKVLGKNAWKLTNEYIQFQCAFAAQTQHKTIEREEFDDRIQLVVNM